MVDHIRNGVRALLTGLLVVLVLGLAALVVGAHAAPFFGREALVIRGSSMAPAIPLGSLVAPRSVDPAKFATGDVVSFRLANGVIVTHRVVEVVELADGRYLRTRGDANGAADATLVPLAWVVGVVDWYIPAAGFLLALLSMPSGLLTLISLLIALVLAIWLFEDDPTDEPGTRRAAVRGASHGGATA